MSDSQTSKNANKPISVNSGELSKAPKNVTWPYVLGASFLILGIAIVGMLWAAYWRFGFLCSTNNNIWCDNDYVCPGMYQVDLTKDTQPTGLIAQSSQPTNVTIQKNSDGTLSQTGAAFGGIRPTMHYGQDLLTKFSVNRCKYGLYEFINKTNQAASPPILCECLGKYSGFNGPLAPNTGGNNEGAPSNAASGYASFCSI